MVLRKLEYILDFSQREYGNAFPGKLTASPATQELVDMIMHAEHI